METINDKKKNNTETIITILIMSIIAIVMVCYFGITYINESRFNKQVSEAKSNYEQIVVKLQEEARSITGIEDLEIRVEYGELDHRYDNKYFLHTDVVFVTDEVLKYANVKKDSKEAYDGVPVFLQLQTLCEEYEKIEELDYDFINEDLEITFLYTNYSGTNIVAKSNNDVIEANVYTDSVYVSYNGTYLIADSSSSLDDLKDNMPYYEVTDDNELGEVWAMAQSFIKDQLKSPSSARFPVYGDNDVNIMKSGNTYKIVGYVDADNSYGAKIRATFVIVLEKSGSRYIQKECTIYD